MKPKVDKKVIMYTTYTLKIQVENILLLYIYICIQIFNGALEVTKTKYSVTFGLLKCFQLYCLHFHIINK